MRWGKFLELASAYFGALYKQLYYNSVGFGVWDYRLSRVAASPPVRLTWGGGGGVILYGLRVHHSLTPYNPSPLSRNISG